MADKRREKFPQHLMDHHADGRPVAFLGHGFKGRQGRKVAVEKTQRAAEIGVEQGGGDRFFGQVGREPFGHGRGAGHGRVAFRDRTQGQAHQADRGLARGEQPAETLFLLPDELFHIPAAGRVVVEQPGARGAGAVEHRDLLGAEQQPVEVVGGNGIALPGVGQGKKPA